MFICSPCLKQNYTNDQRIFKSFGTCEICNVKGVCNDVVSSQLKPKETKSNVIVEMIPHVERMIEKEKEHLAFLQSSLQKSTLTGNLATIVFPFLANVPNKGLIKEINSMIKGSEASLAHLRVRLAQYQEYAKR